MEDQEYILQMRDIVKRFPGVLALNGVQLQVGYGEVHSLIGENGAGKSTISKCIAGIYTPTSGDIVYKGKKLEKYNTAQALKMGISMIHQELSPVLTRPIMENLWLGREPKNKLGLVDHKRMYDLSKKVLEEIDLDEDPRQLMSELTVAKMQMVEIAKAISYNSQIIIMDEPTSALTEKEISQLFRIIRRLKDQGKSILYISHKLEEIFEISDKVTIFRDGQYIDSRKISDIDIDEMIKMMVGRSVDEMFPKVDCPVGEVKLEVNHLSHSTYFNDVSFSVRKGEIFGIAGLVGAGRTEVLETIFGIRKKVGGEVKIDGKTVEIKRPRDAIDSGIAFLTEDRRLTGIFPVLSVRLNIIISNIREYLGKLGLLNFKKIRKDCISFVEKIQIKTPDLQQRIENLSGGNQQKVLVARWLLTEPEILFLDEPTRGIDVGSKSEIHKLVTKLAGEGKSIVMVSSELPEVMGMSDRIMVMHEGKVTGILENSKDLTQEQLMAYATGTIKN